jgi:DNA-binding response OmpR family regulator
MNKCRILIVEENMDLAQILQIYLESKGHQVMVETRGSRAITTCREHLPDALLVDVDLGDISGFSIYTQLRNDPQTAHVHIALLAQKNIPFDFPSVKPEGIFFAPFDFTRLNVFIRECCSS